MYTYMLIISLVVLTAQADEHSYPMDDTDNCKGVGSPKVVNSGNTALVKAFYSPNIHSTTLDRRCTTAYKSDGKTFSVQYISVNFPCDGNVTLTIYNGKSATGTPLRTFTDCDNTAPANADSSNDQHLVFQLDRALRYNASYDFVIKLTPVGSASSAAKTSVVSVVFLPMLLLWLS